MTALVTPPLGAYVHLPWCVRKCPYCDFNSHTRPAETPYAGYIDALLRDADGEAAAAGERPVESLFIGGGTPSLFPPAEIGRLLDGLDRRFHLAADCEITLEANPGTVELERFRALREVGVNRLSIGVQSFNGDHLHALGRIHRSDEAERAAEAAVAAGFEHYNLDLMFALPGQTVTQAAADIERAVALGARHVSHYQLTLEPGTPFHARPPTLPDEDTAAAMQDACAERLAQAGLRRYEVSAWAAPGHACGHNLNYWRFGDYLALGAGGHGKLTDPGAGTITRYSKVHLPQHYMTVAGSPQALATHHPVPPGERPLEFLMNALRLTEGVAAEQLTGYTGLPWAAFEPGLRAAAADGLVEVDSGRVRPTPSGIEFLNETLAHFLE